MPRFFAIKRTIAFAGLALLLSGPGAAVGQEFREWRDNTGTFQVKARLLSFSNDAIRLELVDGRRVTVPRRRISHSDLAFLERLAGPSVGADNQAAAENILLPQPDQRSAPLNSPPLNSSSEDSASRGVLPPVSPGTQMPVDDVLFDREALNNQPPAPAASRLDEQAVAVDSLMSKARQNLENRNAGDAVHFGESREPSVPEPLPNESSAASQTDSGMARRPLAAPDLIPAELAASAGISIDPSRATSSDSMEEEGEMISGAADQILAQESDQPIGLGSSPEAGQAMMPVSMQAALQGLIIKLNHEDDPERLRELFSKLDQLPIAPGDQAILQAIERHLKSEFKFVRETAFLKTARLSKEIRDEVLRTIISDESQAIRWRAYDYLKEHPRPTLLPELTQQLILNDRYKILSIMPAFGNEAQSHLMPLLDNADASVRMDVCKTLGDIGTAASIPGLERIADKAGAPLIETLQAQASLQKIRSRLPR